MKVMAIDPGDHIGVVIAQTFSIGEPKKDRDKEYLARGITIEGNDRNVQLWELLEAEKPDIIVYESFALRGDVAKHLVGNKFVTCEVIGCIKLYFQLKNKSSNIKLIGLLPSSKEYCGFSDSPKDPQFKNVEMMEGTISEHVRDAYRLYRYYKLFGPKIS